MEPKIVISKELYDKLQADSNFLSCLEACGVYDWLGYERAQEMLEELLTGKITIKEMKNYKENTNLNHLVKGGDKIFFSACVVLACALGGSIMLLIAALIAQF